MKVYIYFQNRYYFTKISRCPLFIEKRRTHKQLDIYKFSSTLNKVKRYSHTINFNESFYIFESQDIDEMISNEDQWIVRLFKLKEDKSELLKMPIKTSEQIRGWAISLQGGSHEC